MGTNLQNYNLQDGDENISKKHKKLLTRNQNACNMTLINAEKQRKILQTLQRADGWCESVAE